jgi:hypothetical protein
MTARLTAAEARALGLAPSSSRSRTTRRSAPGPYRTTCHTCSTFFASQADEDRHLDATGHPRYTLDLTRTEP